MGAWECMSEGVGAPYNHRGKQETVLEPGLGPAERRSLCCAPARCSAGLRQTGWVTSRKTPRLCAGKA